MFRGNLKKILYISFILILLIPSLTIGWVTYENAKNQMQEKLLQGVNESTSLLNELLTEQIKPKTNDMIYLSNVLNSTLLNEKDQHSLILTLSQYAKLHPQVQNTYVGAENGQMFIEPNQKLPDGYDPRQRSWYQDAMKEKGKYIITKPYIDAISGDMVITISMALKDGSGVVGIDLNLKSIQEITKQIKIGESGYAVILDQQQRYLSHPTAKLGSECSEDWVPNLYQNSTGELLYTNEGSQKELYFVTNELTGWKLIGTYNMSEINQASKPILQKTILVLAISLILGLILVFFIIRLITKPIDALILAVDEISQGDLTKEINFQVEGELGKLKDSFNRMVISLRSLVTKIREQSEQLAASSEELTASAEQTGKAAEHIATVIEEMAAGSEQQTVNLAQTDQTVHELLTGIQEISQRSIHVSNEANKASEIAFNGNIVITETIQQMNSIQCSVEGMTKSIGELGDFSQNIGKIVDVIGEIANQTNLLALNAAIEAARAGEQGRGFAVVADEVRKLAEQSSQSTKQIGELILEIQQRTKKSIESMETTNKEVTQGMNTVQTAGEAFAKIKQTIDHVASQTLEVSNTVMQLSESEEQVVRSIDQITKIAEDTNSGTQTVAASTEEQLASMQEIASSAAALSDLAQELQEELLKFKV
ncbi:MAG TPA: methyl-accepting chemotaxis protein [Bacillota bacterium]|nr:methyl-accepting chemotaxis protein [Bacillota bacterium]